MTSHLAPLAERRVSGPGVLCAGWFAAILVAGAVMPTPGLWFDLLLLAAEVGGAGWLGWRAGGRLLPDAGLASRAVCALALAVASITCTATLLGHFGRLRPAPFFFALALQIVLALFLPPTPLPPGEPWARPRLGSAAGLDRALLLAAALALGLRFGGSLLHVYRDPGAFLAYDDLSYHLPAAAVWHRYGDLRMIKPEIGDPATAFYPLTSELASWALFAPLGGSDLAARRTQLPFALGSLLAIAAVARACGLSRRSAVFAALLYAAVDRIFPVLALGAGNDHATAFFSLAGLDGILALARRPRRGPAIYAGVALGLLVGTKYLGILFAGTLLGVLGVLLVAAGRGASRTPAGPRWALPAGALAALGALVASMALAGGYAYARNLWTTGNPVFPAPVGLFGHPVFPGWIESGLAWRRHRPEFRIDSASFLLRRPDLFGPLFAWAVLPAALLAPAVALVRRRARLAAVLVLPAALFLEFRFLMPDHRDIRYLLPAIALGGIALAWLLELLDLASPIAGFALGAPVLLGIVALAAGRLDTRHGALLAAGFLAAAALAVTGLVRWRRTERPRFFAGLGMAAGLGGIAVCSLAVVAIAPRIERYRLRDLANEPAAAALERAAGPAGAPVAYVGSNQPYLYFGRRLQNDLQIVPTTGELAARYYAWGGTERYPFDRGAESSDLWRRNLAALGIRFVVAARSPDEGPERAWMIDDPRAFRVLYRDPATEVWQLAPPATRR